MNKINYKLCPKCELNYIKEDEEMCDVCHQLKNTTSKPISSDKMPIDYSQIISGVIYGTNSRKIYEKFCESLGWDISKVNKFGFQKPLYAENADTNRVNDVWFICYPNYDPKRLDNVVGDRHVVNLIQDNNNRIIEIVEEKIGRSHNANRITFVKTQSGYMFLGVYKIVQNGSKRIYERISKVYP